MPETIEKLVHVPTDHTTIEGMLVVPKNAQGIVLFAHGSGSSRHSARNNYVAHVLHQHNFATLLLDLLTPEEDQNYQTRFDIPLLTRRLLDATSWIPTEQCLQHLPIGFFGASTGAAAALQAAAACGDKISAVVSRGGRPDLAGLQSLQQVRCPALLLVGGLDGIVIDLNQKAYDQMQCQKQLVIIDGATHLFEEPGTLEEVAHVAAIWFSQHLKTQTTAGSELTPA